ncbi:MAG: DEAD/DEAH box helicase [Eubacterium sp.]|nr:DEAD/DEAH box helicase [Eubacterium sp.]
MDTSIVKELNEGFETAFVNASNESLYGYRSEFLTNNHKNGVKVISVLERELQHCDEFSISVAFITMSGVEPLLQTLKDLENKGVKGRILTTDYLTFSEPKALKKLNDLKNITVKMYCTEEAGPGFHTKGYIFKDDNLFRIIIGSSNITQYALTVNHEWNTRIVSTDKGKMAQNIIREFESLWNSDCSKQFSEFYDDYEIKYNTVKRQREIVKEAEIPSLEAYKLQPNVMQTEFIRNLSKLREDGSDRALLISATGTGKTYASAFGVRDVLMADKPNARLLFVVHREQIAKQAKKSFKIVFGDQKTYGLVSRNAKDLDAQFIFSTMQTMSKSEIMSKFQPDEFTCIILDEAHRTGAESYQKIMSYFKPEFWLGMTASPERTDSFDVFELFDHNIACEIRLQAAMEENLLCPFHYFGITDLEIDGKVMDDETGFRNFNYLVCDDRVDYIIQQANYYGYSGDRVKGLIFCSRREEARELSDRFNIRGYRTAFLSGDDSQERREELIERLTSDNTMDYLDYIFTVDIFNEGVDIPEINQVIMLRPTKSPIIFVQQLGRGLRKADKKEFVVIIDFIGNYRNNFMIPIALSGDRTYNKDNVRRYVGEGNKIIPGSSTVHFDEISKKRIYAAIDTANFSDIKLIKENYTNLKYKLGHIPELMDFDKYGEMDVLRIFDNKSLGSYYKFLVKYEPEYKVRLTKDEERIIEFISRKLANGKRIHEIELLSRMLYYKTALMAGLKMDLSSKYNISMSEDTVKSIANVMTNEFPTGSSKKTYEDCVLIQSDGNDYKVSDKVISMFENSDFFNMVRELVEFGRYRYNRDYSNLYEDTELVLYQKYTYEDVCRLLNWEHGEVPLNIGGYKYDEKTKTFPVFINYEKSDDIQDTVKYEDHFISPDRLIAISKSNRSLESEDVQNFIHSEERGIDVELFVRKNKDDKISKEFYYLGRMRASGNTREFVMPNTDSSAVEIEWMLNMPVRSDLYEYITNE